MCAHKTPAIYGNQDMLTDVVIRIYIHTHAHEYSEVKWDTRKTDSDSVSGRNDSPA